MFFDDYPLFFTTSKVGPQRGRLNLRYEAVFADNRDIFEGARVLDIASHDGRWAFAALQNGARHVTGVEARQGLVDNARETFSHYGQDPETFRFVCGDVFDVLSREKFDVDVVLCLGFLYHTYRHTELLSHVRGLEPTYLVIESQVEPVEEPFVRVHFDNPDRQGQAVPDPYSHARETLVGRPSVPALRRILWAYDFDVEHMCDWQALVAAHPEANYVGDYRKGTRVTLRCRTGAPAQMRTEPAAQVAGSRGSATAGPDRTRPPGSPPGRQPVGENPQVHPRRDRRWRDLVNRGLAKATGYELRRASGTRRS